MGLGKREMGSNEGFQTLRLLGGKDMSFILLAGYHSAQGACQGSVSMVVGARKPAQIAMERADGLGILTGIANEACQAADGLARQPE